MMRAFQKLKRKHKKHKNTNGCNNTTIRFYYFKFKLRSAKQRRRPPLLLKNEKQRRPKINQKKEK